MNLRPSTPFQTIPSRITSQDEFVFSVHPIIVLDSERVDIPDDIDSGDETDEEDHEARIVSSWHHRALLGDEDRVLYTDFGDTDWDAVEEQEKQEMALIHLGEEVDTHF